MNGGKGVDGAGEAFFFFVFFCITLKPRVE